jgi:putative transposase
LLLLDIQYKIYRNDFKRKIFKNENTVEIKADEGFLYLAGIEDLFQRKVVGWSLGNRITKELTISSLEQALGRKNPGEGLIFHSDRGSQYAAYAYQDVLGKYCIRQSMSRKGNCYDNACMESFFSTLKKDII